MHAFSGEPIDNQPGDFRMERVTDLQVWVMKLEISPAPIGADEAREIATANPAGILSFFETRVTPAESRIMAMEAELRAGFDEESDEIFASEKSWPEGEKIQIPVHGNFVRVSVLC